MADWQTISSLATAGGTLVLALATFSAVRSSNRSARIAEQTMFIGMMPLLVPSRSVDPDHKVLWADRHAVRFELVDVGAHDAVGAVGVEFFRHEAAYVVGFEDRRIEGHRCNASPATPRRGRHASRRGTVA